MEVSALGFYALAVIQAYLLGAVPFGYLLARQVAGIDVRTAGSGNIGATNVARLAGWKLGAAAFIFDVGKGLVAATLIPFAFWVIAQGTFESSGPMHVVETILTGGGFTDLRIACALAAIIGHVWTVFLRFKGGKGVATSLGAMLGLAPWPVLVAVAVWVAVTAVSRYVSLGSVAAAAALPVAFAVLEAGKLSESWRLLAVVTTVALIVIFRHRGNMKRLFSGGETRFNFRRRRDQ